MSRDLPDFTNRATYRLIGHLLTMSVTWIDDVIHESGSVSNIDGSKRPKLFNSTLLFRVDLHLARGVGDFHGFSFVASLGLAGVCGCVTLTYGDLFFTRRTSATLG
jgi:hypothetical protein